MQNRRPLGAAAVRPAVEVDAGAELSPGSTRLLFRGNYINRFDAAPDGQRFLMMRRVSEPGAAGPILLD